MPTAHLQPVAAVAVPSLVDEPGQAAHVAAPALVEPAGPYLLPEQAVPEHAEAPAADHVPGAQVAQEPLEPYLPATHAQPVTSVPVPAAMVDVPGQAVQPLAAPAVVDGVP